MTEEAEATLAAAREELRTAVPPSSRRGYRRGHFFECPRAQVLEQQFPIADAVFLSLSRLLSLILRCRCPEAGAQSTPMHSSGAGSSFQVHLVKT